MRDKVTEDFVPAERVRTFLSEAGLDHGKEIIVYGNRGSWVPYFAQFALNHYGVDGVVVGRGCLGRPWLFRDLAAAFDGEDVLELPSLGEVSSVMRRHAKLLGNRMAY